MREELLKLRSFVEEMNMSNSSTDKIEVLKKYVGNEFVTKILWYTYNSYLNFNITSTNLKKKSDYISETKMGLFELLDKLNTRDLSGHMAIRYTNYIISQNKEFEDLLYKIIDRNLEIRVDVKTINKVFYDMIPTFNVALANSYDDHSDKVDFTKDQWYCSRKLDGCRCITIVEDGIIKFYSREGKEFFTLDNLKKDIGQFCFDRSLNDIVFDGEICVVDENGDEDFTGIVSQIKRKDYTIERPKYFIFDMMPLGKFQNQESNIPLSTRYELLNKLFEDKSYPTLEVLKQHLIKGNDEFEELKTVAANFGWEGLILRKNVGYKGKRSSDLLKVKSFKDSEYEVMNVIVGPFRVISKETGLEETIETMTNIIIHHKGSQVSVGSGFSLEQRKKYYDNPQELIGQVVTVKYFQESVDKHGKYSLRFPTIKVIHGSKREV